MHAVARRLDHDLAGVLGVELALPIDVILEVGPFDELERDVIGALGLADIENLHNVFVAQLGGSGGFAA